MENVKYCCNNKYDFNSSVSILASSSLTIFTVLKNNYFYSKRTNYYFNFPKTKCLINAKGESSNTDGTLSKQKHLTCRICCFLDECRSIEEFMKVRKNSCKDRTQSHVQILSHFTCLLLSQALHLPLTKKCIKINETRISSPAKKKISNFTLTFPPVQ